MVSPRPPDPGPSRKDSVCARKSKEPLDGPSTTVFERKSPSSPLRGQWKGSTVRVGFRNDCSPLLQVTLPKSPLGGVK